MGELDRAEVTFPDSGWLDPVHPQPLHPGHRLQHAQSEYFFCDSTSQHLFSLFQKYYSLRSSHKVFAYDHSIPACFLFKILYERKEYFYSMERKYHASFQPRQKRCHRICFSTELLGSIHRCDAVFQGKEISFGLYIYSEFISSVIKPLYSLN